MSVYVRVKLAAEAYAIPVEHVLEVTDLGEVTTVAGARPGVLGLRNLRGRILPVVDLASLLRISRAAPPLRLVVVEAGGRQAGLAVDAVTGIGDLPSPDEKTDSDLLAGAALSEGDLIGIIDVTRVLGSLNGARS